jgi:hypothetical protein
MQWWKVDSGEDLTVAKRKLILLLVQATLPPKPILRSYMECIIGLKFGSQGKGLLEQKWKVSKLLHFHSPLPQTIRKGNRQKEPFAMAMTKVFQQSNFHHKDASSSSW